MPTHHFPDKRLRLQEPTTLLARGYFTCTSGSATRQRVEDYLDTQGEHHGYSQRVVPPVYVKTFQPESEPQPWWQSSAYVGSYGDLATPQVQEYIRRWRSQE